MAIEYKIKFEQGGLTITQYVEPSSSTRQVDGEAQVAPAKSNAVTLQPAQAAPLPQKSLPAKFEQNQAAAAANRHASAGPNGGDPAADPHSKGGDPAADPHSKGGDPAADPHSKGGEPATQFPIQTQEKLNWCWAAVGASIANYFSVAPTPTQCQLAGQVLGGKDCCTDPNACDQEADLDKALQEINTWTKSVSKPSSFGTVRAQIEAGLPVCVRIEWFDTADGHFVAICGYSVSAAGSNWVEVADPFYGNSMIPYSQLVTSYLDAGKWTKTYFVQPPE